MDFRTKLKIRSDIKAGISSGYRKIDIFNTLNDKHGFDPLYKRILTNIPSKIISEKYNLISKILVCVLATVALIKAYFLYLGMIKPGESHITYMVITLLIQCILVWGALNPSRTALGGVAFYSSIQLFEYYKGLYASNSVVKISCSIILILLVAAIGLSAFLYFKFSEKWFEPNNSLKADIKSGRF